MSSSSPVSDKASTAEKEHHPAQDMATMPMSNQSPSFSSSSSPQHENKNIKDNCITMNHMGNSSTEGILSDDAKTSNHAPSSACNNANHATVDTHTTSSMQPIRGETAVTETTTTINTPTDNPDNSSSSPFRMQVKTNPRQQQRTRKRKLNQSPTLGSQEQCSSSGSSSSSSSGGGSSSNSNSSSGSEEDTDEESQQVHRKEGAITTKSEVGSGATSTTPSSSPTASEPSGTTTTPSSVAATGSTVTTTAAASTSAKATGSSPETHGNHNDSGSALVQPEGWRVKLYRLNTDGSWDDCGTGRIVCLYRQQPKTISSNPNVGGGGGGSGGGQQLQRQPANANQQSLLKGQPSGPVPGSDQWLYQETGEATLCVHAEVTKQNRQPRVLLRTRILLRDAYQRQGDNIITWCEPYYAQQPYSSQSQQRQQNNNNHGPAGVDLALSFQDNAGCMDIWRQITHIQQYAADLMRQIPDRNGLMDQRATLSAEDMAAQIAAEHHSDLQRQQHHELWAHLANETHGGNVLSSENDVLYGTASMMDQALTLSLPNPPTLLNLEEIADTIAALQHSPQHAQHRESLALWIARDECHYLRQLLCLFPEAEAKGDYGKLATLAACVKTVLLMNEPSILELIVTDTGIFEEVCSCLEYDPDLREKANHRWFLRERAKFRTVVPIEDPELIAAIHRTFRVNYLRDTVLRPTMDESALSTLSSLQTFTHADVVKGVMMSGAGKEVDLKDSYLMRVIRVLGVELYSLAQLHWSKFECGGLDSSNDDHILDNEVASTDLSVVVGENSIESTAWKQYLAPQDKSLTSRIIRKRGCLAFLRELFNMVRLSLQQCDKENFFPVICAYGIDLNDDRETADNSSQVSQIVEVGSVTSTSKSSSTEEHADILANREANAPFSAMPVTLLSLLAMVLSDSNADISDKGIALEIVSGVAMHDPNLIRQSCTTINGAWKEALSTASSSSSLAMRPEANEVRQLLYLCPPNDLLASFLFLMSTETDAGILLQITEIMRVILDTDMIVDHGHIATGLADEAVGIPPNTGQTSGHAITNDQPSHNTNSTVSSGDQKLFLSLFYEQYVTWLVAPFQFSIVHPIQTIPESVLLSSTESPMLTRILASFKRGVESQNELIKLVTPCAVRSSFVVELLSFCARAHLFRMKSFLLKSRVLGNVLQVLRPNNTLNAISGDRCLKLAALRFLRAILSVNDEFYHRHIIQNNLFAPVFEALRANPVGDNLVSSAIVEMCDYIHNENIKSLLEYIVTKHLTTTNGMNTEPSIEDVSSPYVSTLTVLRRTYEANVNNKQQPVGIEGVDLAKTCSPGGGSRYFAGTVSQGGHSHRALSGKALEDQRKFREADEEESYFESDDVNDVVARKATMSPNGHLGVVDEVDSGDTEKEFHRTPRMVSFSPNPGGGSVNSGNVSKQVTSYAGHDVMKVDPQCNMEV